jgi:5-methylcytosine-specific restriction endonuclease McrA
MVKAKMTKREAQDRKNYLVRIKYSKQWFSKRYTQKRHNAFRRGISFDLTKEEFIKFYDKKNCFYCGEFINDIITFDRVDNNKGYIKGNIVICCHLCNNLKRTLDSNIFKQVMPLMRERLILTKKIKAIVKEAS